MPRFKTQRRSETAAEETARDEGTTGEYARVEGGERADGSVPSTTTHAHGITEHDHEGGDTPHEHQAEAADDSAPAEPVATPSDDEPTSTEPAPAPDQAISGAGPDAPTAPSQRDGYTAPWGTGGFTLSEHSKCMTGEQQNAYWRVGPDALPEECREGHPRR